MTIDRGTLLDIYTRTMRCARSDEKIRSMLMGGKLAVLYYTYRGQELVSSAMMAALEPSDYLVTTYRGQHDQIAKGVPLDLLYAEIAGKVTGTCKGKGGSMHITHPETGVMVTTGVVGVRPADCQWPGSVLAESRRWPRDSCLFWRRSNQYRSVPRSNEHGPAIQAPSDLLLPEQSVW